MGCTICINLEQIFGMPFVAMGIRMETLWLAFLDIFTVDKLLLMVCGVFVSFLAWSITTHISSSAIL